MKFIVVLVLAGLIFTLSHLSIFNLKKIDCRLDDYPCPLTLEPVLVGLTQQNIFKLNRRQVINKLTQVEPTFTDIKITKQIPNRLLIQIRRRQPLARVAVFNNLDFSATLSGEMTGKFQLIDQQGQLYAPGNLNADSLPLVAVPGEFNHNQVREILLALNRHYVSFNLVVWLNSEAVIVKTNQGPYAVIDPAAGVDSRIGSLQYILTSLKIGDRLPTKIDLRFDKPVLTY